MARRYGIGFWAVIIALVATFIAEPSASRDVSVQVFQGLGDFGGAIVSELSDGEGAG